MVTQPRMLTMFRCLPISFIRVISVIKFRRSSRLAFAGDKKCIESYWQIDRNWNVLFHSFLPFSPCERRVGEGISHFSTRYGSGVNCAPFPGAFNFTLSTRDFSARGFGLQLKRKSSGRQGKVLFGVLPSFLAIFCCLIWQSTKACKLGRNRRV